MIYSVKIEDLEKNIAEFVAVQRIIDSMEPTEFEKKLDEAIDNWNEMEKKKKI